MSGRSLQLRGVREYYADVCQYGGFYAGGEECGGVLEEYVGEVWG